MQTALRMPIGWVCLALLLLAAPLVFSGSLGVTLLSQIGIAVIACLSFNLLLGQGGMLSFGHATYTGCGAFAAIHALRALTGTHWELPVFLLPLLGGLAGMVLALLLGWVCTRRPGTAFAMITLGMGELVYAVSLMLPQVFGGEAGVSANRAAGSAWWGVTFGPALEVYYLIAAYTYVCVAALYAFTFTPLGRLLNAVRDNAERVAFIGYNPHRVRYSAFVISGFFAGIAGALGALNFETVNSEVFGAARSGAYLLFTYLGGTASFLGPILGAVLMVLSTVLFSSFTQAWLLYLGLLFMAMVIWVPGGLASWVQTGLRLVQGGKVFEASGLAVRLLPGAMAAFAGAATLVEMAYHRQMGAAVGADLRFLGTTLNTASPQVWAASLAALVVGAGLLKWQKAHCAAVWSSIAQDLHAR